MELTAIYNPPQDIITSMPPGEGSVSFNWLKQEYQGEFNGQNKDFPIAKWHDKEEGAIKAAR
eukprot:1036296-Karenia_brevis.AAC.1